MAQVNVVVLHEVYEATRRGHEHVTARLESADLSLELGAAHHDDGFLSRVLAHRRHHAVNLLRELARGSDDKGKRAKGFGVGILATVGGSGIRLPLLAAPSASLGLTVNRSVACGSIVFRTAFVTLLGLSLLLRRVRGRWSLLVMTPATSPNRLFCPVIHLSGNRQRVVGHSIGQHVSAVVLSFGLVT